MHWSQCLLKVSKYFQPSNCEEKDLIYVPGSKQSMMVGMGKMQRNEEWWLVRGGSGVWGKLEVILIN